MRVFGIDPGSNVTGWGMIRAERGRYHLESAGVIRATAAVAKAAGAESASDDEGVAARLHHIHSHLVALLATHKPEAIAIEAIFHHKSSESALRLGQARGVALLAAAQAGLPPTAYNPMVVKKTVGAHGRADKEGVAKMVRLLLGADLDLPADATDALAIAITHAAHARWRPS